MHKIVSLGFALSMLAAPALAEPIRVKLASPAPAPAPINKVFGAWAERVTQASNGSLIVEFVPGGVLGKEGQLLDRVAMGVVQMAWDFQGYYPGKYPKSAVAEQPYQFRTAEQGSRALQKLHEDGLLGKEYDDVKVLSLFSFPNASVMLKTPLEDLSGLAGRKITAQNPTMQAAAGALGGTPVNIGIPEWYQAISRGVIDGAIVTFTAVPAFRLNEVMKYYVDTSLGGNPGMFIMNKAAFERLPSDAAAAISANTGLPQASEIGAHLDRLNEAGKGMAAQNGNQVVQLTASQADAWEAALHPLRDAWLGKTENGVAIVEAFRAEASK